LRITRRFWNDSETHRRVRGTQTPPLRFQSPDAVYREQQDIIASALHSFKATVTVTGALPSMLADGPRSTAGDLVASATTAAAAPLTIATDSSAAVTHATVAKQIAPLQREAELFLFILRFSLRHAFI
jgi:hypothetical protein